jgi:phosphoenolpyruvate carboxykinase (ATP)
MGVLSDKGALCVNTGKFTGRSPKDRFIVKDAYTEHAVNWNNINIPFDDKHFNIIEQRMLEYFSGKDIYVKDAAACAHEDYRLNIRLVAEYPWSAQFAGNMFLRPDRETLKHFSPDWTILSAPGYIADPAIDGTRQGNFAIIHFSRKMILIGGTGYTGEIKKGIFSVLNFILPFEHKVLSMHCSANVGEKGDTAVFFGLSGTGKTTLSANPDRWLIGDDEHGWAEDGVFNFEGGCYAKCIDLTEEKEPDIYRAIKHGAILENIMFHEGTRIPDYTDDSITENTRVSYPIDHISNALIPSRSGHPKNIFFLTCDAFGVLPPISKLTPAQAMYHFISGYTAKVAGTEDGVTEPEATFSNCFGAPFLPLHPTHYAKMLGDLMQKHGVNVWLVNTGWTSGSYGTGYRIKLSHTRGMIAAALNGALDQVAYKQHETFGLSMPVSCPNLPNEILDPRNTWEDATAYDQKANHLAQLFVQNFKKFEEVASPEMLAAAPKVWQHS